MNSITPGLLDISMLSIRRFSIGNTALGGLVKAAKQLPTGMMTAMEGRVSGQLSMVLLSRQLYLETVRMFWFALRRKSQLGTREHLGAIR